MDAHFNDLFESVHKAVESGVCPAPGVGVCIAHKEAGTQLSVPSILYQ